MTKNISEVNYSVSRESNSRLLNKGKFKINGLYQKILDYQILMKMFFCPLFLQKKWCFFGSFLATKKNIDLLSFIKNKIYSFSISSMVNPVCSDINLLSSPEFFKLLAIEYFSSFIPCFIPFNLSSLSIICLSY